MIKHLLILTTYGQIFFSQEFGEAEETVDVALTGGLMSAIYSMATETQREKISEFEMVTSRIIFKEEKNELLFVLTVDKRMDNKDADDLLNMIAKRFFNRYGYELQMDGLILSEFEEDVTQVINQKLWYLETDKEKFTWYDHLSVFCVSAILFWYIHLLFNITNFIWVPLITRLHTPLSFLLYLLMLTASISGPGIILYWLFKKTKVDYIFRFSREYLMRPTRASYSELLPNYFLYTIFISYILYFAFMMSAGAYFSEITAFRLFPGGLLGKEESFTGFNWDESDMGDQYLIGSFTWFSWVFLFPLIYSSILGEKDKQERRNVFRNAMFISSIAIALIFGCLVVGGTHYQQMVGFNPTDLTQYAYEAETVAHQFLVRFPLNIFFYGFLLFLGIGIARVSPSKTKVNSLIGIWVSIYLTLMLQRLFYSFWSYV